MIGFRICTTRAIHKVKVQDKGRCECRCATRAAVRPERVLRLREKGLSIRGIAEQTGVSAMTVQRILAGQGTA
jgi:hypothetical protein